MCKGSSSPNTTTTTSGPPPEVLAQYNKVTGVANQVAQAPLNQYAGSMVAGFTPQQQQSFQAVQDAQGLANPFINSAAQYAGASATPINVPGGMSGDALAGLAGTGLGNLSSSTALTDPANYGANISSYMSPYTQQVVDATQAQFNNANAQQNQGIVGNAITKGAWGGDRAGVAQGIAAGQEALAQAPVIAGLYNSGFTNAQGQLNQTAAQRQAAAQQQLGLYNAQQQQSIGAQEASGNLAANAGFALGSLGQQAQSSALTNAAALYGSGSQQQQLQQQQLNIPYEQFQAQQAYPFQASQYLSNISQGIGGASGGQSSTTAPGPSTGSQILGGLTGAAGLLGATGGFGSNGYLSNIFGGGLSPVSNGAQDAISQADSAYNSLFSARGGRIRNRAMGGHVPGFSLGGVPLHDNDVEDASISFIPTAAPGATGTGNSWLKTPQVTQTSGGGGGGDDFLSSILGIAKVAAPFILAAQRGGRIPQGFASGGGPTFGQAVGGNGSGFLGLNGSGSSSYVIPPAEATAPYTPTQTNRVSLGMAGGGPGAGNMAGTLNQMIDQDNTNKAAAAGMGLPSSYDANDIGYVGGLTAGSPTAIATQAAMERGHGSPGPQTLGSMAPPQQGQGGMSRPAPGRPGISIPQLAVPSSTPQSAGVAANLTKDYAPPPVSSSPYTSTTFPSLSGKAGGPTTTSVTPVQDANGNWAPPSTAANAPAARASQTQLLLSGDPAALSAYVNDPQNADISAAYNSNPQLQKQYGSLQAFAHQQFINSGQNENRSLGASTGDSQPAPTAGGTTSLGSAGMPAGIDLSSILGGGALNIPTAFGFARGGRSGLASGGFGGGLDDIDYPDAFGVDQPSLPGYSADVLAPSIFDASGTASDNPMHSMGFGAGPTQSQHATARKKSPTGGRGIPAPPTLDPVAVGPTDVAPPADLGISDDNTPSDSGNFMRSPWMALAAAGAGMMSSRSPFMGTAIGEGLESGLKYANQQDDQADKRAALKVDQGYKSQDIALRAQQLSNNLQTHKDTLDLDTKKLSQQQIKDANDAAYQRGELGNSGLNAQAHAQEAQRGNYQPVRALTTTDPVTGEIKPVVDENGVPQGILRDQYTGHEMQGALQDPALSGRSGAGGGTSQWKYNAYLLAHPGDQQGALDFVAGHKEMSDADAMKAGYALASKEVSSGNASADDMDKLARGFAQNIIQANIPATAAPVALTLDGARAAIAAGAPRDKVIERLKAAGVDSSGL